MAIGLKSWNPDLTPEEAKMHVYAMSNRFIKEFVKRNNTIKCKELLDADLSTEEGRTKMKEENLSEKVCEKAVSDAADILSKMF